ncbi:MAG: DUF167 family protein [Geminicoccaceae bacterium]
MSLGSPLSVRGDGIELAIKASPRAGRSAIGGVVLDDAGAAWLAVKLAAPANDGRANAALLALLAKGLGVPASACSLAAGPASRWKRVSIAGDPEALASRAAGLARAPAAH